RLNVAASGKALVADHINVAGGVLFCDGFTAEGNVQIRSARIGSYLDCHKGLFKNPAQDGVANSGTALTAEGANFGGGVMLNVGFMAEGEVRFVGSHIGGNLVCGAGRFINKPQAGHGNALNVDGADIVGDVFLDNGFTSEGNVRLLG